MGKPIWGNGQITMTVHNYKSKQVNKTLQDRRWNAELPSATLDP